MPNPLPPQIDFDRSLLVKCVVDRPDWALGELTNPAELPNPNLLIRPFIRRESVLSSRIEGTRALMILSGAKVSSAP